MLQIKKENMSFKQILKSFLYTVVVTAIATAVALAIEQASNMQNNILGVYMLAVVIVSTVTSGYFWGILASVVGIVGVNYFFTYPYFAINFLLDGYPITFLIMLLLSCISSWLTGKIKKQALIAQAREKRFEYLYTINKDLLSTFGMDNIIALMLEHFHRLGDCSVIYYKENPTKVSIYQSKLVKEEDKAIFQSENEIEAANQAYVLKKMTGAEEFSDTKAVYIPLISHDTCYGVVGILLFNYGFKEYENLKFMQVMALQFILAMDRQTLFDDQQKILVETEKEKMRSNLLRAVSHDLRTPLTCIQGSSAILLENKDTISDETYNKLLTDIQQDCQWLVHMVENLLSVTRISEQKASVKKQPEAVEEVVEEAVMRIKKRFSNCRLAVHVPDDFLMVPMDATLIKQVIINLVENSIRHSKAMSPIQLRVEMEDEKERVCFRIIDDGVGIDPKRLIDIFDGAKEKSYSDSSRGLGIGLSICKSIILAHKGMIEVYNNPDRGVTFQFSLPMKGAES